MIARVATIELGCGDRAPINKCTDNEREGARTPQSPKVTRMDMPALIRGGTVFSVITTG